MVARGAMWEEKRWRLGIGFHGDSAASGRLAVLIKKKRKETSGRDGLFGLVLFFIADPLQMILGLTGGFLL